LPCRRRLERFLSGDVLAREPLRFGLLRGDVGLERGDQALDAGDFGGLGGFVVLGVLHVVPRG
jgi:hypothetical protein